MGNADHKTASRTAEQAFGQVLRGTRINGGFSQENLSTSDGVSRRRSRGADLWSRGDFLHAVENELELVIHKIAPEFGRELNMRIDPKPHPRTGLLAGAVGGLIACFAMSQFHSAFQNVGIVGPE